MESVQRIVLAAPRSEPIGEAKEVFLVNGLADLKVFEAKHVGGDYVSNVVSRPAPTQLAITL